MMVRFRFQVFAVSLSFASALIPLTPSLAGIQNFSSIQTSSPAGAWRYSESAPGQAPGFSTTYEPAQSDLSLASFVSYVTPDHTLDITGGDTWLGSGNAIFEVFSTYVLSDRDQTINIRVAGDDGHSLFVGAGDTFIDGGGFAEYAIGSLNLTKGVPQKVTMAVYNGPANWVGAIGVTDNVIYPANNPVFDSPIENVPGITLNADGDFPAPEPEATLLCISGLLGLTPAIRARRSVRKES